MTRFFLFALYMRFGIVIYYMVLSCYLTILHKMLVQGPRLFVRPSSYLRIAAINQFWKFPYRNKIKHGNIYLKLNKQPFRLFLLVGPTFFRPSDILFSLLIRGGNILFWDVLTWNTTPYDKLVGYIVIIFGLLVFNLKSCMNVKKPMWKQIINVLF